MKFALHRTCLKLILTRASVPDEQPLGPQQSLNSNHLYTLHILVRAHIFKQPALFTTSNKFVTISMCGQARSGARLSLKVQDDLDGHGPETPYKSQAKGSQDTHLCQIG